MSHEWEALAEDPEIKPLLTRTVEDREVSRTYMRHAERTSEGAEVASVEHKLSDPVERKFLQNPGKLAQQNARRKTNLLAQSPPTDLRPSQRDKLKRLEAATHALCSENMPTAEEMRHNPPGVVDHQIAWQRATKRAMLAWKNCRILLNPDSDAVDLANFERYRPAHADTRRLFTDGQIGGQFALGPQAKANYPNIDWSSPEGAEKIQEEIDAGRVKVRVRGAPAHRSAKTSRRGSPGLELPCEADGCGAVYRGGFARQNLARHTAKVHGVREEVPA